MLDKLPRMCYTIIVERGRKPHDKRCNEPALRRVAEPHRWDTGCVCKTTDRYINQQGKDDPQGFGQVAPNSVGMDGAEPKNFFEKFSNYPLTNWKKYGKIITET